MDPSRVKIKPQYERSKYVALCDTNWRNNTNWCNTWCRWIENKKYCVQLRRISSIEQAAVNKRVNAAALTRLETKVLFFSFLLSCRPTLISHPQQFLRAVFDLFSKSMTRYHRQRKVKNTTSYIERVEIWALSDASRKIHLYLYHKTKDSRACARALYVRPSTRLRKNNALLWPWSFRHASRVFYATLEPNTSHVIDPRTYTQVNQNPPVTNINSTTCIVKSLLVLVENTFLLGLKILPVRDEIFVGVIIRRVTGVTLNFDAI